ncbi:MAG: hypothetical protein Q3962_09370 [Corynebacterium sp.]|nr:hypothetical protein [Corynebacterium sp.]
MTKNSRVSRGIGRMAIASTLALATTASVMVAPQMAQVANAAEATVVKSKTIGTNDNGSDTLVLNYMSDGTMQLVVNYYNVSGARWIPMVDMSIHYGGLEFDHTTSTLRYQDLRTPGSTSSPNLNLGARDTTQTFGLAANGVKTTPEWLIDNTQKTTWDGVETAVIAAGGTWTATLNNVKFTSESPYFYFSGTFRDIANFSKTPQSDAVHTQFKKWVDSGNTNAIAVYGQNAVNSWQKWSASNMTSMNEYANNYNNGLAAQDTTTTFSSWAKKNLEGKSGADNALYQANNEIGDPFASFGNLTTEQHNSYADSYKNPPEGMTAQQVVSGADNVNEAMSGKANADANKYNQPATTADKTAADARVDALATAATDAATKAAIEAAKQAYAGDKASALDIAKGLKKAEVAADTSLTQDQKDQINKEIDKAQTPEALAKAEENGKAGALAVTTAKDEATKAVQALDGLTPDQKQSYLDQIAKAADGNAATDIAAGAANVSAAAKDPSDAKASEASTAADKQSAKEAIDKMANLSDAEKQNFKAQVDAAGTAGAVAGIVGQAAQQNAKNGVDKLENLTAAQKQSYKDQIDALTAGDAGTVAGQADAILAGAQNVNAANTQPATAQDKTAGVASIDAAQKRSTTARQEKMDQFRNEAKADGASVQAVAKAVAKAEIEALDNLSNEQKDAYEQAVDAATDAAGVAKALEEAKSASAGVVDKAKQDAEGAAKEAGDKANNGDANGAADAAKNADDAAQRSSDAADKDNTAANHATAAEAWQKAAEAHRDAAQAAAKAGNTELAKQEADKAQAAANKAKEELNKTKNAPDANAADTQRAETAADAAQKAADAAKQAYEDANNKKDSSDDALQNAKNRATNVINKLPYLTDDQKKGYTDRIAAATTPEQVVSILTEALQASVNANPNLSDAEKDKYNDALNNAKNTGEIDNVINENPYTDSGALKAEQNNQKPSGSSLSSGPALWVWIVGIIATIGGILGWGYVHDADFRAVVDTAIANAQRAINDALGIRR